MLSLITIVILIVAIGLQMRINRKLKTHIDITSKVKGPMGLMGPPGPQGPKGEVGPTNPMTEIEINMRKQNDAIIVEKLIQVHPELRDDKELMELLDRNK